ncbi:tetratricopeptide repeat protein [Catellatospora sp. NPDC049609]|uniref:tetratricopeptide repeat protein n=1 Tax=Catellatospora sp. NPDC049609 TaxID=3155505 RepID=UPI00342178DE
MVDVTPSHDEGPQLPTQLETVIPLAERGDFPRAVDLLREALDEHLTARQRLATSSLLGAVLRAQGDFVSSVRELRIALAISAREYGPDSMVYADTANNLGVSLKALACYGEADYLYEKARAIIHAQGTVGTDIHATLLHNIAGLAHARGAAAEGVDTAREAVGIRERLHGADDLRVAADLANLGGLLFDVAQFDEAEACFNRALHIFRSQLGSEHAEVAVNLNNLAALAEERGSFDEAEELYDQAIRIKNSYWGPEHPETLLSRYNRAHLLFTLGRLIDAASECEAVVAALSQTVNTDHPTLKRAKLLMNQVKVEHDSR